MRIMAIDYGDSRTGLAVSDATCTLCGEAWIIEDWNIERVIANIIAEAKAKNVG